MRRCFSLLLFAAFSFLFSSAQQIPQALNYQAVARTANGLIIPSQKINVRFSILEGTVNGTAVYQETQSTTSNAFGLFVLAIGKGNPTLNTFSAINWSSADKFLKVELSADGSANYLLQGTTQLLSVPFALYAEKTKLVAGNAISITNGNVINASYQGGTGVAINGNTISGNYQAGTGVAINGNTISHSLQAGTGIAITGATISHNLVAGNGIAINGNSISSTVTSYWQPHTNGIYYNAGKVGIGVTPDPIIPLTIFLPNTGIGSAALHLKSDDVWHTAMSIFNGSGSNQKEFSFIISGPNNTNSTPGTFGLFNHQSLNWSYNFDPLTNNMAIGSTSLNANNPKSKLHVFNGDINVEQIGSGIILKSPNGSCWRVTVDNAGNLVRTAISCP